MGIRLDHEHKHKQCYIISSRWPLTKWGMFRLGNRNVTGAYMGYTGSWYFWDPQSGEEVAQIHSSFWDRIRNRRVDLNATVESMRIGDLVADPDCQIGK